MRNFVTFLEQADGMALDRPSAVTLDKAGHLMYASHVSYTRERVLGADEADVLVDLVRRDEREGFYGAKITGGGSGGTVAVLANTGYRVDVAVARIVEEYGRRMGGRRRSSAGAGGGVGGGDGGGGVGGARSPARSVARGMCGW